MDQVLLNKKVLIAEDEPAMLSALADKFEQEGCVVIQAQDGQIALDCAVKERPDIILLDILMPKMNGMEVLDKIRKGSDWGSKVPIVILTNVAPTETITTGVIENKPSLYLIKVDWKLSEVVQKIRYFFENPTS